MKNLLTCCFLLSFILGFTGKGFAQTCPGGMISYWRLQGISGNIFADEMDNHNALAGSSPSSQTTGVSGSAQHFNAYTYLSVPSHSDFNWSADGSFTLELWVKYTEISATEVIIGRDDPSNNTHWYIGKTDVGKIEWYMEASDGSNGAVESSSAFNDGQWHHIAALRNGSLSKNYLYIDGLLQNAGGTTVTLTAGLSSTAAITLGNMIYNNVPMFYYDGDIDEVAIYNRVLTPTEVSTHNTNAWAFQMGYCSGDEPEILSSPVTSAVVSQAYGYDVDASGNPLPTYSLVEAPVGMTINSTTGVISWTPASLDQNAPIVVRATNDKGSVDQEFNIFLANGSICNNNLLAYWSFDTHGSPYIDNIAGYKLTGIHPMQTTGRVGNALVFDGVNDSLNMKDFAEPDNIFFDFDDVPSFSIELWMKSNHTPSETMVMVGRYEDDNNSEFWIGVNTDGTVGFFVSDHMAPTHYALLGGGSVLDGEWHHIVATLNSTTNDIKLYVDKILVDNANVNTDHLGGHNNLNIGCEDTPLGKFWYEGVIDELAFYNIPLPEATIINNYTEGIAGNGVCVPNYSPLILSTPVTDVNEDSPYSYTLISSELNKNDITTITVVTKPAWVTFTYNAGDTTAVLTGTTDNSLVGNHYVTLRVSDGVNIVDHAFQITVANVNDAPTITSIPVVTTQEDELYSYTVTGNDIDAGSTLIYTAPVKPGWLTFNPGTHILSGTPTNDNIGVFDITVRVSDGTEITNQSFQLTVNNVNEAPTITSVPVATTNEDVLYSYTVIGNDIDAGSTLVYTVPVKPSWLTFNPSTHVLSGTPTNDNIGIFDITVNVSDGIENVNQLYQLAVNNVNDLPVITSTEVDTVNANLVYLYDITATDADVNDILTFTAVTIPDWLTFTPGSTSGVLTGTPTVQEQGTHAIVLKVSDGQSEILQNFTLVVLAPSAITDIDNSIIQSVFPNPVADIVYFRFAKTGKLRVEIYDISGNLHKLVEADKAEILEINVSDMSNGIYIYKVYQDSKIGVGKITKE